MIWWIILILIFAIWLYFKINRSVKHKNIVGKKVLVNYFDQNTDFETIFPMTGTVTEKIKVGSQTFFVVQFEESFVYHNRNFDKIVIKERHAGYYIGGRRRMDEVPNSTNAWMLCQFQMISSSYQNE